MKDSWIFPTIKEPKKLSFLERVKESKQTIMPSISNEINYFHNAYDIPDISKAALCIQNAIEHRVPILIFGDYDCDGVGASLILRKYISSKTKLVTNFIPNRLKDGYGMKMEQVKKISNDIGLVITVDTGITSYNEIEYLKKQGKTVVLTDHHICPAQLPPADAVVDCYRKDSRYPFNDLCGAGVALKLVSILCDLNGDSLDDWEDLFVYAMLSTIADAVPLIDENRALVKKGLEILRRTTDPCLLDFFKLMKIDTLHVSSEDIAFLIAPAINASSRISGSAKTAMMAFCNNHEIRVHNIERLIKFNQLRKAISKQITLKAERILLKTAATKDFMEHVYPICIFGKNWDKGVLGIVAAKIAEKYNRPTIIFSNSEKTPKFFEGSCRGSANVPISIYEMLESASSYIEKFGGHEFAAGLTIKESNKESFYNAICKYVDERVSLENCTGAQCVDAEIYPKEIGKDSVSALNEFEPFGNGNKEPLLFCRHLQISSITLMGQTSNHLRVVFKSPKSKECFTGVFFFQQDMFYAYDCLPKETEFTAVFKLKVNRFRGTETTQLILEDLFPEGEYLINTDDSKKEIDSVIQITEFAINRFSDYPQSFSLELLSLEFSSVSHRQVSFDETIHFLETMRSNGSIKMLRINNSTVIIQSNSKKGK